MAHEAEVGGRSSCHFKGVGYHACMLKLGIKDLAYKTEELKSVMPNELLVLDLSALTDFSHEEVIEALQLASLVTRKFSLLVTFRQITNLVAHPAWLSQAKAAGLKRLHLLLDIDVPPFTYAGLGYQSPYVGQLLAGLKDLEHKLAHLKITPCLSCPPDQIHHLGPLLTIFSTQGYQEALLIPPARRTEKAVMAYRQLFEYLRLRGVSNMWISFDYFHRDFQLWNVQSYNAFVGPETVHFDISNKCTHSCNFCGLYGPDAIKHVKNTDENNRVEVRRLMSSTLDYEKGRATLETLPETVRFLQFGGIGDPMTHPQFMDFVRIARERGIECEVLSNMDYFTEETILEVTRLGSRYPYGLHYIANISGSNADIYLKTRPRQNQKNYDNVMKTLARLKEEREKNDGHGVYFTMMIVMNITNYRDAESYVRKSKELGATRVYLKPMEIHIEYQSALLIPERLKVDYSYHISQAIKMADELGLEMQDREALEKVIELHPPKKEGLWGQIKEVLSV